ncbi:hypothetical protein [Azospirillum melinis]
MSAVLIAISFQLIYIQNLAKLDSRLDFLQIIYEIGNIKVLSLEERSIVQRIESRQSACMPSLIEKDEERKSELHDLCMDALIETAELMSKSKYDSKFENFSKPKEDRDKIWVFLYIFGSFLIISAKYIERMHLKK